MTYNYMNIFKDKKVCLILTCDRHFYINRLRDISDTIQYFKESDFIIVYLYGYAPNYELTLDKINETEYKLYVPVIDCYEMLSAKMEYAYKYLNEQGVSGVLKIDDDVKILDKDYINNILDIFDNYDYFGIYSTEFGLEKIKLIMLPKFKYNLFKTLCTIYEKEPFKYFVGPFYYLSKSALAQVCSTGLISIYEDISVGHSINQNPNLKVFQQNNIFWNTAITWGKTTET